MLLALLGFSTCQLVNDSHVVRHMSSLRQMESLIFVFHLSNGQNSHFLKPDLSFGTRWLMIKCWPRFVNTSYSNNSSLLVCIAWTYVPNYRMYIHIHIYIYIYIRICISKYLSILSVNREIDQCKLPRHDLLLPSGRRR